MRDWERRFCEEPIVIWASITGWLVLPFTKTETHEDKGNEFGSNGPAGSDRRGQMGT